MAESLRELSDEEVFGAPESGSPVRELSDDDVFGAAESVEPAAASSRLSRTWGDEASDIGRQLSGAIYEGVGTGLRGVGKAAQIVGEYTTKPLAEAITGRSYQSQNALDPVADYVSGLGQRVKSGISEEAQSEVKASAPSGDLFSPSTWSFGENPTVRGYVHQMTNVFGQMVPIIMAAYATGGAGPGAAAVGGAVAGGAQGGGAAVEEARRTIDDLDRTGRLGAESAHYRALRERGVSHEEALDDTRAAAENLAFLLTAPVSGAGGALTGAILHPASSIFGRAVLPVRAVGRGIVGGVEEGTQEVAESFQTKSGINLGAGTNLSTTEGTFGDFLLGALGGTGPAIVSGAASQREARAAPVAAPASEAIPEGAIPSEVLFPSEPEAAAPGQAPIIPQPQEAPDDRQVGPGLPSEIGIRQEPVQAEPVQGAGAEALGAGGVLQAPATAEVQDAVRQDAVAPPAPPPGQDLAPKELAGAIINDPRPVEEIRADLAAARAAEDQRTESMYTRSRDEKATQAGAAIPPTQPGYVRFYHGGPPEGGEPPTTGGGRWTTTDFVYARDYRSVDGRPGQVWYVDIPKGDTAEVAARAWDEMMSGTNQVGTYRSIELPEAWARQMRPVPVAAQAAAPPAATIEPAPTVPVGDGSRSDPVRIETSADVTAASEQTAQPTPAQAEAGNYRKRHVNWAGFDISIETEAGQERSGVGPDGKPWSVVMPVPYGYIKGSKARDGDHVDVFLGPNPEAKQAYVIDQIDPISLKYDEPKIMAGFPDEASARAAYAASFSDGKGEDRIGAVTPMGVPQLQRWVFSPSAKKALAYQEPAEPKKPRASAKYGPLNIFQFLAMNGGIRDQGGELAALGLTNVFVPGFGKLVRPNGRPLDNAREAAAEAGYFPGAIEQTMATTTPADLLNLLDQQGRGTNVFSYFDLEEVQRREAEKQAKEQRLSFKQAVEAVNEAIKANGFRNIEKAEIEEAAKRIVAERIDAFEALSDIVELNMYAAEAANEVAQNAEDDIARTLEVGGQAAQGGEQQPAPDAGTAQGVPPGGVARGTTEPGRGQAGARETAPERGGGRPQLSPEGRRGETAPERGGGEPAPAPAGTGTAPTGGVKSVDQAKADLEKARAVYQNLKRRLDGIERRLEGPRPAAKNALDKERIDKSYAVSERIARSLVRKVAEALDAMDDARAAIKAAEAAAPAPKPVAPRREEAAAPGPAAPTKPEDLNIPDFLKRGGEKKAPAETEKTTAGEQAIIPGAEKIGQGEQAQRAADKPLKPKAPQKPADEGLFGDESKQTDLLDVKPKVDKGPHFAAGAAMYKEGNPRQLPSYFTQPDGKNARMWFAGWDAAKKEAAQSSPSPAETPAAPASEIKGLIERIPGDDGTEVLIVQNSDGKRFNVIMRDTDAQETIDPIRIVSSLEQARRKAREMLKGPSPAPAATPAASQDVTLANALLERLRAGKPITAKILQDEATAAYGGTLAEGKFDRKDAYDALELAVNMLVKENIDLQVGAVPRWNRSMQQLGSLLERLPTQTVRSEEQQRFQQFSTPPHYAYSAAFAANLRDGDVVLEPSAGTGSLVAAASRDGVTIVANELSPRRAELLRALIGDQGRVFTENAEQLNNILPGDVRPTVVVMNPPFSQTAGRMGDKKVIETAAIHIEQALKRLAPGGRLVAIVGRGMTMGAPRFRTWWDGISKGYAVRANIGVERSVYEKYGTQFGTRLLVIDKVPPTGEKPVTTETQTVDDLMRALEPIRNARPETKQQRAEPSRPEVAAGGEGAAPAQQPAPSDAGAVGAGERGGGGVAAPGPGRAGTSGGRPARVEAGERPAVAPGQPGGAGRPEGAGARPVERPAKRAEPEAGGGARPERDLQPPGGEQPGSPAGGERLVVEHAAPGTQAASEITDTLYESYEPKRLKIEGAKKHPGPLVESAAMSSVAAPKIEYSPSLPKAVVSEGKLSLPQLEAVIYAGQAHARTLPAGEGETARRRGFFIGDGTGVGKGREIAGIILDNWQQGRTKAVWVSEKKKLMNDAKRDWSGLGQDANAVFDLGKVKSGEPVKAGKGIGFITYDTLKGGLSDQKAIARGGFAKGEQVRNIISGQVGTVTGKPQKTQVGVLVPVVLEDGTKVADIGAHWRRVGEARAAKSRIDQIAEWLGKDFDGVVAFDEAHNMGNAVTTKGTRGIKEAAQKALAGLELQARLPNARVVYVSATGATEVSNLAYADRLGLWGRGTPFASREQFVNEVEGGGIAAMELIARDMKQLGAYLARNLSYDGVEYQRLEHKLTEPQREIYDTAAEAWQVVLQNITAALKLTGGDKARHARSAALSAFWGGHQRFFNQIVTSLQMPSVIKAVERDLAEGRQAVLQLTNTNEASQERAAAKAETAEDIEDLDITPRDQIIQLVENSFPTQQYEQYVDADGNERSRPVFDAAGNPVQNAEAVAMRDQLIDRLASIRVPQGPLDLVLDHFGAEVVAEVTGRKRRFILKDDEKTGERKRTEEARPGSSNQAETDAFQAGKKKILVFSEAGGTGASYHADNTAASKNARRTHYLVQAGWRADKAVQGFGRTHRTNQASAPIFNLVTTDLDGQKRFISSIARRLAQLGALTKGQRQAGDQGVFSARDNLESREAELALEWFYRDLIGRNIEDVSVDEFENQTGLALRIKGPDGAIIGTKQDLPPITQFLNRLLSLKIDMQNKVFAEFSARLDHVIEQRTQAGKLDAGLETVKADKIEKVDEQTVYTSPEGGAETKYVKLTLSDKFSPITYKEVAKNASRPVKFWAKTPTGKIVAIVDAQAGMNMETGAMVPNYRAIGPTGARLVKQNEVDGYGSKWTRGVTPDEARNLWDAELEKAPEYTDKTLHLITGAVLPIWDRLKGSPRVVRLNTSSGERLIGRVVPNKQISETLKALGAESQQDKVDANQLYALVIGGGRATLANGWVLNRRLVAGEHRIELTGPTTWSEGQQVKNDGVFTERINSSLRYFVPVEEAAAIKTLTALTEHRPVIETSQSKSDDGPMFARRKKNAAKNIADALGMPQYAVDDRTFTESELEAAIRAYHGSPYDYAAERLIRYPDGRTEYIIGKPNVLPDVPAGAEVVKDFPLGRVRLDKIGTGEGNTAFGRGWYSAENEGVARGYRDTLAKKATVLSSPPKSLLPALRKLSYGGYGSPGAFTREVVRQKLNGENWRDYFGVPDGAEKAAKQVDEWLSGISPESGRMYEVNIRAKPEEFLDWDKPLNAQSEGVKAALAKLGVVDDPKKLQFDEDLKQIQDAIAVVEKQIESPTQQQRLAALRDDERALLQYKPAFGAELYERLGSKEEASSRLREAGIPGIRYLDQGSRSDGKGTYNYVVFDDALVDIVRKYARRQSPTSPKISQEAAALVAKIFGALRTELDRLGLSDVGLKLARTITGVTNEGMTYVADGIFHKGVITIALDAKKMRSVLHHEALHALKKMGLFSDSEWALLSRNADRWMEMFDIKTYYPDFPDRLQVEEAIAHAYQAWVEGRLTVKDGRINRLMRRISQFFEAFGNALRGNGFKTAEDVFRAVERGEVGGRARAGAVEGAPAMARKETVSVMNRLARAAASVIAARDRLSYAGDYIKALHDRAEVLIGSHEAPEAYDVIDDYGETTDLDALMSSAKIISKVDYLRPIKDAERDPDGLSASDQQDFNVVKRNLVKGWAKAKEHADDLRAALIDVRRIQKDVLKEYEKDDTAGIEMVNASEAYDLTQIERALSDYGNSTQESAPVMARKKETRLEKIARMAREQEDQMRREAKKRLDAKAQKAGSDVVGRVEDAYFDLTGGLSNKPVLLSDLRAKLAGISRADVDAALNALHLQEGSTLSGLDNPREITPSVKGAAVDFKGREMYVLWISRPKKDQPMFARRQDMATIEGRQQVMQGYIARGQPLDRAMRLPFDLFGGFNSKGEWNPGAKLSAKAADIIVNAKFSPRSWLRSLNPILEAARAGLIDRYSLRNHPDYIARERGRSLDERGRLLKLEPLIKSMMERVTNPNEARVLQAILTGEAPPQEAWNALSEPIRAAIDIMGQEAVELGQVSPESFERNRGAYVHRVYKGHEAEQNGLYRMVSQMLGSRRKKVIGSQMKGRGMFHEVPVARLMRDVPGWNEAARGAPQKGEKFIRLDKLAEQAEMELGGEPPPAKVVRTIWWPADQPIPDRYSSFKNQGTWEVRGEKGGKPILWRDFTKAEREKMGEILDARYTVTKSFMLAAHDLATGRFYKDIAENENWAVSQKPSGNVVSAGEWREQSARWKTWKSPDIDWVKVPDDNISQTGGKKKWGALAGMYVREEIWRDLNEIDALNRPSTWRTLLTFWKGAKTYMSPGVHVNNIMSNAFWFDFADGRIQDFVAGVQSYRAGDQHYQEALENGAFGSDIISQEMRDTVLKPVLDEIMRQNTFQQAARLGAAAQISKFSSLLWSKVIARGNQFARSAYQMEDEIFRMGLYLRRRQQGASPREAADDVRRQFIDYDIRAPWVNMARNSVLPFISYTYRSAPLIAHGIATRPWKPFKYMALFTIANALAYALTGGDEEKERKALRDEEQGRTWLMTPRMVRMPFQGGRDGKQPVFLDMRRWIPGGDIFDLTQSHAALPFLPSWLTPGGPLMLGAEFLLNHQAFTGQDIVNERTDDMATRVEKTANWAWKGLAPNAPWVPNSYAWDTLATTLRGGDNAHTLGTAALSSVGVKVKPLDVEDALAKKGSALAGDTGATQREITRLNRLKERGKISESEHRRLIDRYLDRIKALQEKAQGLNEPTFKSPKEIRQNTRTILDVIRNR